MHPIATETFDCARHSAPVPKLFSPNWFKVIRSNSITEGKGLHLIKH
jgi:hypothetical protein